MKSFNNHDIACMEQRFRANFINSLTGFKSVNLVGTQNLDGQFNLAIFSQVFHLGANPPLIGLILRPAETERHTYENMKSVGYFTLNHILPQFCSAAHQTSARYSAQISEFEACGIDPEIIDDFNAPFVKQSKVKIGLRFVQEMPITINNTILLIGQIEKVIIHQSGAIANDGFVDLESLQSITSSGLDSYHITQKIHRFSYAKINQPLHEI
jgi:flavin reductase (DIM6/NTAB) family NADH-FMN oxidoreductase RutF